MIARLLARLLVCLLVGLFAVGAVDPNDPFKAATIIEHPGAPIPLDAPLTTSAGEPTTLRRIAGGKPLLIVPVQHRCPNICGVTLAGIAAAIDGQARYRPGRDFVVVAFGIDPREGPAAARADLARLARQRPGAHWRPVAVTGAQPAIRRVTDALGYRYAWSPALRQYAHMSATAVLTTDGRMSSWLYGLAPTSAEFGQALARARAGRTGGIMRQVLLLCFHYDPRTGRWSLAVIRALRIAGTVTALGIGLALVMLSRRARTPT
jgi:protein SCO1/2